MNLEILRTLVELKSGQPPESSDELSLSPIKDLIVHPDVNEYICYCLPRFSYQVCGIAVQSLRDIIGEMHPGAAPGGYIRPYGYLVIANSAGGNVLCLQSATGKVFWTDHDSFLDDSISIQNRSTGDWEFLDDYTPENVQRAMVLVSDDLESFLVALLNE